jgi:hypothetical protein
MAWIKPDVGSEYVGVVSSQGPAQSIPVGAQVVSLISNIRRLVG